MGNIVYGPIKSEGKYFIPSPEPIEKLGNTIAMAASASLYQGGLMDNTNTRSGNSSSKEDKENYGKILPSYQLALRQQKRDIGYKDKAVKQYAMKTLKDEYHGDVKRFLEGEQLKYKNGEGYYAAKEQLLQLEDTYNVNKSSAEMETDKYKLAEKSMYDNSAQDLYYVDPASGGRVEKGKDDNGNSIFFKNKEWLDYQSSVLGIGENGSIVRGSYPVTNKPDAFNTEFMKLAQMASSNMSSGAVIIDGKEYDGKTNSDALATLKQYFYGPLSKGAKEDYRQKLWEFQDAFYSAGLDKDESFKNLSADKKADYIHGAFIESAISPTLSILNRKTINQGGGSGSGYGGSKDANGNYTGPVGPFLAFQQGRPTSRVSRKNELVEKNEFGQYGYAPTDLQEMPAPDPSLLTATNIAYQKNIEYNNGVKFETVGDYWWDENGVPNSMDVFAGKKAFVYSLSRMHENRVPIIVPGVDEDGNVVATPKIPSFNQYETQLVRAGYGTKPGENINKAANAKYQQKELTFSGTIAVEEHDMPDVIKKWNTLITEGKAISTIGRQKKNKYQTQKIGDKNYYIIPVEFPATKIDVGTIDANAYTVMNAKAENSMNENIVNEREQGIGQEYNQY